MGLHGVKTVNVKKIIGKGSSMKKKQMREKGGSME
jgi:hypothetical protein